MNNKPAHKQHSKKSFRPGDKPSHKFGGKPGAHSGSRHGDKPAVHSGSKPARKFGGKPGGRSGGRPGGKPFGKGGRPTHSMVSDKLKRYEGGIIITPNETGFVKLEGFEEDIIVESGFLNTALNNDKVEICLFPKMEGERQTGEVMKIIKRARTEFVGTIDRKNPDDAFAFLIPDDKRVYRDLFIPNPDSSVKHNYKAVVAFVDWRDGKSNPMGKVVKIIGEKGNIDTEMNSIVYENSLWVDYPPEVLAQAEQVKKEAPAIMAREILARRDMREVTTFTIDPFNAKDFDDALSFRWLNKEEFELGVHIADVTAYVPKDSPMDIEAQKRAFTIYLVDRTIPMLPEALANELCSLGAGVDKLAYSCVLKMNDMGQIKDVWFGRTVIRSNRRFVYEDAQKIIDDRQGEFVEELLLLNSVSKKIRFARLERGAVDFDRPEVEFKLDAKGHPIEIHTKERLDTHKLVEEFMITANSEVAKFLGKPIHGTNIPAYPCLYRIHDKPSLDSTKEFMKVLLELGYRVNLKNGSIPAKEMNILLNEVTGEPEEGLIKTMALRSMSKAEYSANNIGHYGLALDYYAHFTSPIRRYADMAVHNMLTKKLSGEKISPEEKLSYAAIGPDVSTTELRVNRAQYDSIELKQTEYMLDHKGEIYEGVITGIKKFGMFVQAMATQAEGLIHVTELGDDFYELDQNMHALVGRKSGKRYAIGDKVKIKVISGDVEKKEINFVLVE